jgi:hypothetical protein
MLGALGTYVVLNPHLVPAGWGWGFGTLAGAIAPSSGKIGNCTCGIHYRCQNRSKKSRFLNPKTKRLTRLLRSCHITGGGSGALRLVGVRFLRLLGRSLGFFRDNRAFLGINRISVMFAVFGRAISNDQINFPCSVSSSALFIVPSGTRTRAIFSACSLVIFARLSGEAEAIVAMA